jgi:hypothetical protein
MCCSPAVWSEAFGDTPHVLVPRHCVLTASQLVCCYRCHDGQEWNRSRFSCKYLYSALRTDAVIGVFQKKGNINLSVTFGKSIRLSALK